MVTVKEIETKTLPPGSVYLDVLLNQLNKHYRSQFYNLLDESEIKQQILLALDHVIKRCATADCDYDDLWRRISWGSPHNHICILPDTEKGYEYKLMLLAKTDNFNNSDFGSIISMPIITFSGVVDVKNFMFTSARNEILAYIRKEKRHIKVEAPLDAIDPTTGHMLNVKNQDSEKAFVEFIINNALANMRPNEVRAVKLFLNGDKAQAIANETKTDINKIYAILKKFRSVCNKMRSQYSGSG